MTKGFLKTSIFWKEFLGGNQLKIKNYGNAHIEL